MPSSTSYQRLALASPPSSPPPPASSSSFSRPYPTSPRSLRPPVKIDLESIDAGFSKWLRTVRHKSQVRKRARTRKKLARTSSASGGRLELMESVFGQGGKADPAHIFPSSISLSHEEFQDSVLAIKAAIREGVHPKMISKGSSGSYFSRNREGVVIGVFKPKDEEPYGRLNPKWTKWIHRTFFSWVGFGRACLIPNLSYISEAAASRLDERLGLGIVPRTELVSLSSPSFFYEWIQRNAYVRKKKPLPDKVGSLQIFCAGYKDASDWLREHPWPGLNPEDEYKSRTKHVRRCLRAGAMVCGRAGADEWSDDEIDEGGNSNEGVNGSRDGRRQHKFRWTAQLKADFRLELEKLIMLDWLMRNTDRGLDNFMLKYTPPSSQTSTNPPIISTAPSSTAPPSFAQSITSLTTPSPSSSNSPQPLPSRKSGGSISIAAIDNSLSFPHHHPKGWRNYPYGWLHLPVSLIGQPFSDSIRQHMIPLLSSPPWWEKTVSELRVLFQLDEDFSEAMFEKQISVLKGQGASLLESLHHADEGPLELCRRDLLLVSTEPIEASDSAETALKIALTMAPLPPPTLPTALPLMPSTSSTLSPPINLAPSHSSTSIPRIPPSFVSTRPTFGRSVSNDSIQAPLPHSRSLSNPILTSPNASASSNPRPAPVGPRLLSATPNATGVDVLRAMEKVDNAERKLLKLRDSRSRRNERRSGDFAVEEEEDEDDFDDADPGYPSRSAFSDGEDQQRPPSGRRHQQRGRGQRRHHQSSSSFGAANGSLNAIFEAEDHGQAARRGQIGATQLLGSPDEIVSVGRIGGHDRRRGSEQSGYLGEEDEGEDEEEGSRLLRGGDEEEGLGRTKLVLVETIKKVKGDAWFAF